MPVWKRQWQELCQRLGVQPQQFAVLIAVTVVGVGVLTLKSAFGPRTAGAAASTSAKSAASDKTASSAAQSRSETTMPVAKAAVVASTSAGGRRLLQHLLRGRCDGCARLDRRLARRPQTCFPAPPGPSRINGPAGGG